MRSVMGTSAEVESGHRRMTPRAKMLLVILTSLFVSHAATAKIHRGFALIPPGPAWDFSDSTWVFPPDGDLRWVTLELGMSSGMAVEYRADPLAWFLTDAPARVAYAPGDSTYHQLMTAPTEESYYRATVAVLSFGVYVVKTKEAHYAKVRIQQIGGGGITIEYTYQDNGTNVLAEPVAVRHTTWGRIKSLYR